MELSASIKYFIYSIVILLLQILVFNKIGLGTNLIVSIPVLFILLLPIEIPKGLLLLLAFLLGFTIDVFSDTLAFNTAGLVFSAYLRPLVLTIIQPTEGYEPGRLPSVFYFGLGKFTIYTAILTFGFEFFYYLFEIFSLSKIWMIFYESIISTLLSVVTIIILHLLFLRNKK